MLLYNRKIIFNTEFIIGNQPKMIKKLSYLKVGWNVAFTSLKI